MPRILKETILRSRVGYVVLGVQLCEKILRVLGVRSTSFVDFHMCVSKTKLLKIVRSIHVSAKRVILNFKACPLFQWVHIALELLCPRLV